jgi:hypothetical protein
MRTAVLWNRRQVFSGSSVEAFLMVLSVALLAFGLGGVSNAGKELIPMGFSPGSMFQPELLVIVTGSCFASYTKQELLHEVEAILGGVWVFGQLILFTMLGSRTTPAIMTQLYRVLPVMLVGMLFRFAGVLLAMALTMRARERTFKELLPDTVFCFLSTVPRATIQGALGAVPVTQRFFKGYPHRHEAQEFIFIAARLYIVTLSVVGMILLNTIGPKMLQATVQATVEEPVHQCCPTSDDLDSADVSTEDDICVRDCGKVDGRRSDGPRHLQNALELLAQEFSLAPGDLLSVLCEASPKGKGHNRDCGASDSDVELRPFARQNSAPEIESGLVRCDHLSGRLQKGVSSERSMTCFRRRHWQTGNRARIEDCELALAQFEAAGSLMAEYSRCPPGSLTGQGL